MFPIPWFVNSDHQLKEGVTFGSPVPVAALPVFDPDSVSDLPDWEENMDLSSMATSKFTFNKKSPCRLSQSLKIDYIYL